MECIQTSDSGIAGKFLEVCKETIIITMTDKEFNKNHLVVSPDPLKRCIRVFQIQILWLSLGEIHNLTMRKYFKIMLDKHSQEVILLMWMQFI